MIGRQRHETGAEQRVGAGGEHVELRAVRQVEGEAQPFRPADPVLLHDPDFLRPFVEAVERVQQILRIARDAEEPLAQLAPLHQGAGAPAAAVDHLLVGEHGHVDRIPVHVRFGAVDQIVVIEIQEQLLLVLVVVRIAGREFAGPVDREAQHLQFAAHRIDVGIGPGARIDAAVARRVLRRQAERIPAHRVQDVEPLGALEAGDDVAHRVVAHMAHMDAPRRIGEHLQHIGLGPGGIRGREKAAGGLPGRLPFLFRFLGVVPRHHERPSLRLVWKR